METGSPYMCYKDHVNNKSNQQNIGVIQSSNLCCEVMQYSDPSETAVCNLASISLPECIKRPFIVVNDLPLQLYSREKCDYCLLAKAYLNNNLLKNHDLQQS